jgi:putative CocE/NonD family hydrolase
MFSKHQILDWLRAAVLVGSVVCVLNLAPQGLARTDNPGLHSKAAFGVGIPMRDGVVLSADVWRPAEAGRYPAILIRTPYLKTDPDMQFPELGEFFARQGYALVAQDVRGRGDSDGKFNFFFQEESDGYDSVEWIAAQPWCNGKVGMMGASYMGTVQWLGARSCPPHLVCIVPTAAAGRYLNEFPSVGGAFRGAILNWVNGTSGRLMQTNSARLKLDEILTHRPLNTADEALGRLMPLYREFLAHPTLDSYWRRIQFSADDFRKINIPALTVTGWFDGDQPGALFYWEGMAANSPARNDQYLVAGPWIHEQTYFGGALKLGEMVFSGDSVLDMKAIHLAFFDHYLKGLTKAFQYPRARIYVTGTNRWLDEAQYPPPASHYRSLYLHSKGKANSLVGDGALIWDAPASEPPDRFMYNPQNPAPDGASAQDSSGADQRAVERRDDVLVYTSKALDGTVEVVGRVFVNLYAATDGRDTDFTAKLLDVYPDGRALKLCVNPAGVVRARYRNGLEREELLTPAKPELYKIWLFDIAHAFLAGHRIRIEISSSAFPFVCPNPNTGNPISSDTKWRVASQTIYHDERMPSSVELPVMTSRRSP